MTIAENLQRIQTAKTDIKTAIENKGVNVGDITIDGYAAKIDEITVGGSAEDANAIKNAEVLTITENGTYYTKYADDVPEFNEPQTGDGDFYSYVHLQKEPQCVLGYIGDSNTIVELWFRHYGDVNTNSIIITRRDIQRYWELRLLGETATLSILDDSYHMLSRNYQFTLPSNIFNKIKFSLKEVWLNDELIMTIDGDYSNTTDNWKIGGLNSTSIGDYGMVKIDDNIYVPNNRGFLNLTSDYQYYFDRPEYTNYVKIIKPIISDNLYKQVNADLKLSVKETQLKLSYFAGKKIPEFLNFDGLYGDTLRKYFYFANINDWSKLSTFDTSKITTLEGVFENSNLDDTSYFKNWDVSKVSNMNRTFYSTYIKNTDGIKDWYVSNVTDVQYMFGMSAIAEFDCPNWDLSHLTTVKNMFYSCGQLQKVGYMNLISVTKNNFPFTFYSNNTTLTDLGGFHMKGSWDESYGLSKCLGLTVESLVNVLDALYDFTGNGETPTSNEGKLALGATNLAKLTDEQKAIATNKGWTLS